MNALTSSRAMSVDVQRAVELWHQSAGPWINPSPRFTHREQRTREQAYDLALRDVERHAKQANRFAHAQTHQRVIASFAQFAATALDLPNPAVALITEEFLPVGTQLAQWARRFDPTLSTHDIVQACRNAWTACGMQPLLGAPLGLTPAILGYSMLYPYSDNYLDQRSISRDDNLRFSERFRSRLRAESLAPIADHESSLCELVRPVGVQLRKFGDAVAASMDALPHGTAIHKGLLRMSWRSLVLMAVAQAHEYFSPALIEELEPRSPFRFGFLRARRKKLEGRSGVFQRLFQVLLSSDEEPAIQLPTPH